VNLKTSLSPTATTTAAVPENDAPLNAASRNQFRAALTGWFRHDGRDYPWRRTQDPYAILVSEVMLQQTQIATVLGRGYYARWMERFPDVKTLAAAPEADILQTWEGLGYYSRARNLQRAAEAVMKQHGGIFPDNLEAIASLPGVGRYTAGAVLSFAFNKPAPIVDGNVARVLARLFSLQEEVNAPAGQRALWGWAAALTDPNHPREYNSAIMELGQRLCTPRQPACGECPVRPWCRSAGPGAESLPLKKPARATVLVDEHVLWAQREGRLLLRQETGRRRQGLWRLPERCAEEVSHLPLLSRTQYSITHHRVTLRVYDAGSLAPAAGDLWQPLEDLAALPMPGPFRRVVDALLPHSNLRPRLL
jgi:A/G-specific adenine glycosylase